MLRVDTWKEETTGTIGNANAITCIETPDENTEWFVNMYDNNRAQYEKLVEKWISPRSTLSDGKDCGVVLCTIINIEYEEGSHPWYIGCVICKKKLTGADEEHTASLCEKCDKNTEGTRRWILNLTCSDDTGSKAITVYDECAKKLLEMSADEFVETHGADQIDWLSNKLANRRIKLEYKVKEGKEGEKNFVCNKIFDFNFRDEGANLLQNLNSV
jgi:hypothetical protein